MKQGTILSLKAAVFIIGAIFLSLFIFLLPGLAKDAAKLNPEYAYLRFPVLIGLCVTVIPFFTALYEAFKLLIYIESKNAFSELAVLSLGRIKTYAIIIMSLYVLGAFFLATQNALHPGISIIVVGIVFASLVITLFTAVLRELLKSALKLKNENDLTI